MSLTKLAKSFDAKRKKQYWQYLKRLYGGTDEAVQELSKTHDPGIYHGTRDLYAQQIADEGIKPGPYREFGTGSFFGSKAIAELYAKPEILGKQFGNLRAHVIHSDLPPEKIQHLAETNPKAFAALKAKLKAKGEDVTLGVLSRLKMPSELKGTKILYPDVQHAKVFDTNHERGIWRAAARPMHYLIDAIGINRIPTEDLGLFKRWQRNVYTNHIEPLSQDEARALLKQNSSEPEEFLFSGNPKIKLLEALSRNKINAIIANHSTSNLEYYGKIGKRRLFDLNNTSSDQPRHEFFFDQTAIPPELMHVPGYERSLGNATQAAVNKPATTPAPAHQPEAPKPEILAPKEQVQTSTQPSVDAITSPTTASSSINPWHIGLGIAGLAGLGLGGYHAFKRRDEQSIRNKKHKKH